MGARSLALLLLLVLPNASAAVLPCGLLGSCPFPTPKGQQIVLAEIRGNDETTYRVRVAADAKLSIALQVGDTRDAFESMVWLVNLDGEILSGFGIDGYGSNVSVQVRSPAVNTEQAVFVSNNTATWDTEEGRLDPGEYYIVETTGAKGDFHGNFSMWSQGGLSIVAEASGIGKIGLLGDFDPLLSTDLESPVDSVGADAWLDGHFKFSAPHHILAFYQDDNGIARFADMGYIRPDGTRNEIPCYDVGVIIVMVGGGCGYIIDPGAPGDYTFFTRIDVGAGIFNEPLLLVADVPLP